MDRTELREQFFAEARRDPYAHMITRIFVDAWAEGAEQAFRAIIRELRNVGADAAAQAVADLRLSTSRCDREDEALEWLTDARQRSEAQMIVAMAEFGGRLAWSLPPRRR